MDRAKARPVRGWQQRMARESEIQRQRLEEMRERAAAALPGPDLLDPPIEQWTHLHGIWTGAADRDPEELSAYEEVASQEFALGAIEGADMFDADSFTGGEQ